AAGAVCAAPEARRPEWPGVEGSARDVRLPGFHPLLGGVEEGEQRDQAAHGSRPNPPVRQGDSGVVSEEPAPTDQAAAPDAEAETPGPLQLLRNHRELRHVDRGAWAGGEDLAEVAVQAKLERLLLLAHHDGTAGAVSAASGTSGPLGVPERVNG